MSEFVKCSARRMMTGTANEKVKIWSYVLLNVLVDEWGESATEPHELVEFEKWISKN